MRRAGIAVWFVLLAAMVIAQTSAPPKLSSYEGKWQATFQGQPFFIVTLKQSGDKLTGTIQHTRDIHVDNKGVVDKVAPEMSEEQIVDAKLILDHLRITGKNSDSQDENVYELRLEPEVNAKTHETVYKTGTLHFAKAELPADVPEIQPWKVTKVAAK